jgi:hypothetical protein
MTGAFGYIIYFIVGIGRRKSMRGTAELFLTESCLVEGAGCGGGNIFPEDGKCFPQGIGFKGQYYFDIGRFRDIGNQLKVSP